MPNSTRASTSSNTVWAKRGKWQSRWSRRRRQNRLNVRHERVLILLGLDRHRRQVSERREAAMSQRGETAHKHPRAKTLSQVAIIIITMRRMIIIIVVAVVLVVLVVRVVLVALLVLLYQYC